jgi:hypothetical protein
MFDISLRPLNCHTFGAGLPLPRKCLGVNAVVLKSEIELSQCEKMQQCRIRNHMLSQDDIFSNEVVSLDICSTVCLDVCLEFPAD